MNQKYDVDEIFYSIQGEGVYSGSPMIFVRLTGCNLSCDWCLGPNTLIQLISGGASKIKDIRAGDVLLGYDETSGTLQPTTVVTTKQHGGKERWSIKPSSSQTTIATPDHLWMVDGSWKRTDHLETGDEIWTSGNLNYSSWRMRRNNPSRLPGAYDRLSVGAKRRFTGRVKTLEHRQRISAAKKLHNPMRDDPEVARRNAESHYRGMSGGEVIVDQIVKQYELPLRYTGGRGKQAVGSRSGRYRFPDFMHTSERKVVEVYDSSFGYSGGTVYRDQIWEEEVAAHYTAHDYKVLFIDAHTQKTDEIARNLTRFAINGTRVLSADPLHPKSIGPLRGDSSVYDITCSPFPTFFANGLLTHNCDTKYALEASDRTRHLTPEEIALEAKKLSTKATRICITGGEPTLQPIGPLLTHLSLGWTVHIETNGTIPRSPGLQQYYIVLSPKRELAPDKSMLDVANEIKLVVDVPDFFESEFFKPYLEMSHSQITLRHMTFSLQPENNRREMGKLCVEFIKENPQWRLSLQTHKLLGVR